MPKPKFCFRCGQLRPCDCPRAGRPPSQPQADPGATAHFREFLAKLPNGLGEPATYFCDKHLGTRYGPPLQIHHLRKALDGSRPFYAVELDKIVAYAIDVLEYSGYTLPPAQSVAKT